MGDERRLAQVGEAPPEPGLYASPLACHVIPPKISRPTRDVTSEILWGNTYGRGHVRIPGSGGALPYLRRALAVVSFLQLLNSCNS